MEHSNISSATFSLTTRIRQFIQVLAAYEMLTWSAMRLGRADNVKGWHWQTRVSYKGEAPGPLGTP